MTVLLVGTACASSDKDPVVSVGTGGTNVTSQGGAGGAGAAQGGATAGALGGSSALGGGPSAGQNTGGAAAVTCSSADDCLTNRVCDPATRTCVPYQCGGPDELSCAANQACVGQSEGATVGACYAGCTPFAAACSNGGECVPVLLDNAAGACVGRGTAAEGQACTQTSLSTGCAAGSLCVQNRCVRQCDTFAESPGCDSPQSCTGLSLCAEVNGDAAAVGQDCTAPSEQGTYCGEDGGSWRGLCRPTGADLVCSKMCRTTGTDCATGEQCRQFSASIPELGLCVAVSACDDGGANHADCDACLSAETATAGCCGTQVTACEANTECSELRDCVAECANSACVDTCVADHEDGVDLLDSVYDCLYGATATDFGACALQCL